MEKITSTMPRMRNIKYESACLKVFENYQALPRISVHVRERERERESTFKMLMLFFWLDLYTLVNKLTGWSLMTWGSFPSRAGFSSDFCVI